MSIRSRLVALVIALLVPAVLAAAWGIYAAYRNEVRAYERQVLDTARALALLVDREIQRRRALLQGLAASPDLLSGDLKGFYEHARNVAASHENTVVLIAPDGQQLLNTRQPFGVSLPRTGLRLDAGEPFVSNLYMAPIGLRPSFAVHIPVEVGGKAGHHLALGSFASQLQTVFEEQRLNPPWTGAILDREGIIVARNIDPERHVGQPAREDLRSHSQRTPEGSFETATRDRTPVLAVFSKAPGSGWTFAIGVPKSLLTANAKRSAAWTALALVLLFCVGIALALWVGRSIVRPVEALNRAAGRLGQGMPVDPDPTGLEETDRVSAALSDAGERLRGAAVEMERRVNEAVSESQRSQRALLQGQKLEALGRLTGGIAHDFNNLLQTLTAAVHILEMRSRDAELQAPIQSAKRALDRATKLTRQLMAFARTHVSDAVAVDLRTHLLGMADLLHGALRGDVKLEFDFDDRLWPVKADPVQLELALLNIAINARDAMAGGGRLAVSARNLPAQSRPPGLPEDEYVCISLRDSGPGMDSNVLAHALDPFFTTKEVGKGSGLGLPQAYGFAKQSGGTLEIESALGQGTTVRVYLPRARAAVAQPGAPAAEEPARAESSARVLLVEDDVLVRDVVASALRGFGFQVFATEDADKALSFLRAGNPVDVVFSDIVMPGSMSGIDLANVVRREFPTVRLLLATGYSERSDTGGLRTIAKPYDVRLLVNELLNVLARPIAGQDG